MIADFPLPSLIATNSFVHSLFPNTIFQQAVAYVKFWTPKLAPPRRSVLLPRARLVALYRTLRPHQLPNRKQAERHRISLLLPLSR